jgi:hypothetical protein
LEFFKESEELDLFDARQAHHNFAVSNDEAGREYVAAVGSSLEGVAREVRVLDLPRLEHKEDVTDWAEKRGGTLEEYLVTISKGTSGADDGTTARYRRP